MTKRLQRGSLRKRKSGGIWTWLGSYWHDGHHRSKNLGKCTAVTKAEAQAKLDEILRPINAKHGTAEHTLQTYAQQVVFPWYRRSWKPSTAMTTEDRIDHYLLKDLGNKPLSWFTRDNLQDYLDQLGTRPPRRGKPGDTLSASIIGHLRWDLRLTFRMAVNDGLLQRNPAELLHAPKQQPRPQRVLTITELRTLLSALPLRDRLIIKLAGISGMRPGEIFGLQWDDIHEDGLHITRAVYRGTLQTPKTHHSVRTAAISHDIRDDFAEWHTLSPKIGPDNWVFPNEKNTGPLAHGNYWRRNIKSITTNLTMHGVTFQALRRTSVTLLNAHGADATIVAAQCGHTVDVSTNVYNKIGIERQDDAINKLAAALNTKEATA